MDIGDVTDVPKAKDLGNPLELSELKRPRQPQAKMRREVHAEGQMNEAITPWGEK